MLRSDSRASISRRSVIRIVAAFTPLGGCELMEDVEVIQNPPACETPRSGCVPVVEDCPEEVPPQGGRCDFEGLACAYEDSASPLQAMCRSGTWSVSESPSHPTPNPPIVEECPTDLPVDGTPCNVEETASCSYGDCYGAPQFDAHCEGGYWRVGESSCNPPLPECDCMDECPAEPPESGAPCSLSLDACSYGDCYGVPTDVARCVEGFWELESLTCNPPPPDLCPELPPEPGAACSHVGDSCVYGECLGAPNYYADCVNGRWRFIEYSCNPPPVEENQ